jgi:hypothetical protein
LDAGDTINRQSVAIVSQSANGTAVVLANGNIQFTPNPGFVGSTTVTYTVNDNNGLISNIGTLNVAVLESLNQNPRNRFDVNNDGFVSPIDALIVINHLNARPVSSLPATIAATLPVTLPANYMDVDASGFVSAIDILQVINFLNTRVGGGSPEGESGKTSQVASLATPTIFVPPSGTTDVEVLNQKSVRAFVQGQLNTYSVQTKTESAFSSVSGVLEASDSDEESTIALVAFEITAEELRSSKEDTLDSVLEGVLDELGIQ